ncbi:MAG: aspartate--tRNA ligase [Flavobacteriales bacterium]|nr:aspartate--tRNA ligase [Flavobacteriales bacterium]
MHRTHTCGELRISHVGQKVTLSGWVQRSRDKGAMLWIDLRDRYGITQLFFSEGESHPQLMELARGAGREFVLKATGEVIERVSKNPQIPTGDIEIKVEKLEVLNESRTPPFTIEDQSDGGDDLRMQWRYLDLRRNPLRNNLMLRHRLGIESRKYLDSLGFMEVETPYLIKSTPEGARDFVVPSRMNPGQFYALPQSPQTFKQILMVAGYDRYYQIVRCFRDEDLRADRQPEFTQIDCEMAFVEQEDILNTFEGMVRHLFKTVKGIELDSVPRMTYDEAMRRFGSDKPDLRFGMEFNDLSAAMKGKGFGVFDQAEIILGITASGCANYTRKQLDELTEWVKRPQIGAKGLVYCLCLPDGTFKSSVDKFYSQDDWKSVAAQCGANAGDLILVLSGETHTTRKQLNELRLQMGTRLGLRDPENFKPLWVVDFPLVEWNEDEKRWFAMHHPFTAPKPEHFEFLGTQPDLARANAYDFVLNGVEIGGGSIRIHDRNIQAQMFELLGFTPEEAQKQFGFLLNAFEYGAPPHGGIAFGFDRLCALFGGQETIRDFIAFPKNNSGRDMMIDAPSSLDQKQLNELHIALTDIS